MSDSPFTHLQNLTRKPESGISALRLLNPKLARSKLSWPSASVSFRTSAGFKISACTYSAIPFRSR